MQKKVWKLYFRLFVFVFAIFLGFNVARCEITPVDASRNAKEHNNQGSTYLREGDYYAAIKEFKIAIGINPNVQATSVYYNNLGLTYMKIYQINKNQELARWAQSCFEHALLGDCMSLTYYNNLVDTYQAQGILASRASYLLANKNKNPYNEIIVGLIYLRQGKKGSAVTMLDDFCSINPDLIISKDIKRLIRSYNII